MSAAIGEAPRPVQLEVSSRSACEAAAHTGHRYRRNASYRQVILEIDMANAFNSLRRDPFILQLERERAQTLNRLLWHTYLETTNIFYSEAWCRPQVFSSDPALFSLGVANITRGIGSRVQRLVLGQYVYERFTTEYSCRG